VGGRIGVVPEGHDSALSAPPMTPRERVPAALVSRGLILLVAIVLTCTSCSLNPGSLAREPGRPAPTSTPRRPPVATPVSNDGGWTFYGEEDSWGSVSCASSQFCMAGGSNSRRLNGTYQTAQFVLFDGISWKVTLAQVPERDQNIDLSVSCPSFGWCIVYNNVYYGYWIYSKGAWSSEHMLPVRADQYGEIALACASRTFCMALGSPTKFAVYDGNTWRTGRIQGGSPDGFVGGLACAPGTHLCVVGVDNFGSLNLLTYNGSRWRVSYRNLAFPASRLESSCAAAFCLVTNGTKVLSYTGGKWSRQIALPDTSNPPAQASVSCPASNDCYLLSDYGAFETFSAGRLSSPNSQLSGPVADGWLNPFSCPSTGFCMLVGAHDPIDDSHPGYYTYRYLG
jgi:hypothetical protein